LPLQQTSDDVSRQRQRCPVLRRLQNPIRITIYVELLASGSATASTDAITPNWTENELRRIYSFSRRKWFS